MILSVVMRFIVGVVCVSVFGVLCWDASVRLAEAYPSYWICLQDPAKHDGKKIYISASPVISVSEESFVVDHGGDLVRVRSLRPPRLGSMVLVHGKFWIDGTVEAIGWQEEEHYRLKRAGVIAVSLAVVAVGFVVFRRTFIWRDGAFHPRRGA